MMTPAHHRSSPLDRIVGGMAMLILILQLTISPMGLTAIGWNYDGLGGAGPTRFHPASYITVLAFLLITLRDGNPLASVISAFGSDPRITVFMIVWSIVFAHGVINQELPAAALIDTFLIPVLILLIFRRLSMRRRNRMEATMHALLAVNALLGLGEFLTGFRLTPYVAGGILITDDWRSTALLGHPLGNALITGAYTMILLMGGGQLLTGRMRFAIITLQFAAMVAFGGRASLVLLLLFALVMLARSTLLFLAGGRMPLKHVATVAMLVPVAIGGLGMLFELGFFDKFILRFVEDKGSASARIVMFELFRGFTWTELLLGPQQVNLSYYVHVNKLEFGIESVWVAFSLYYGILPTIFFFTGLLFFLFALMSHCQKRGWILIGYFFLINSTFLGIAGKSINFTNFCLLLLLLLPLHPRRPVAPPVTSSGQYRSREPLPC